MSRKGISPVIATVIIVAVAIAISIAVAGWLFGLWGGLAGGTTQVQVSTATVYTNGTVRVYIVNSGSGADTLLKAEVSDGTNTYPVTWDGTKSDFTVSGNQVTIAANEKGWAIGSLSGYTADTFTAGESVTLKLYFEKSGTVTVPVAVSAG